MDGFLDSGDLGDTLSHQGNHEDLNGHTDLEWMRNFDPTLFRETIATDLLIYKNSGSVKVEENIDGTDGFDEEIPDDFPTCRKPTPPKHWDLEVEKQYHRLFISHTLSPFPRELWQPVKACKSLFSIASAPKVRVQQSAQMQSYAYSNLATHHGRMGVDEPPMIEDEPPADNKPSWSYAQLIMMALRDSPNGLPVNEIYEYICKHFPYFRTASPSWKNSVRHTLSMNKNIEKRDNTQGLNGKKQGIWSIRADQMEKVDAELSDARLKQEAIDEEREHIGKIMQRKDVVSKVNYGHSTGVRHYAYPSQKGQRVVMRVKPEASNGDYYEKREPKSIEPTNLPSSNSSMFGGNRKYVKITRPNGVMKQETDGDYENLDPKRMQMSAPSMLNRPMVVRDYVYKPRANNRFSIDRMERDEDNNVAKVHSKQSIKIVNPSDQVDIAPAPGAPKYVYKPRAPAHKFGNVSFKPAADKMMKSSFSNSTATIPKALPSILRKRPISAVIPEPVTSSVVTSQSSTAKFSWDHCYGQKSPLKSPSISTPDTTYLEQSDPILASISLWNNPYNLNSFSLYKPTTAGANNHDFDRLDTLDMLSPFKSPSKNDRFVSDGSESPNYNDILNISPNLSPLTTTNPIDLCDDFSAESSQDPGLYPVNPIADSIYDFDASNSANYLENLYNFESTLNNDI